MSDMDNGNDTGHGSSRRRMLAALGATSATTVAGCMGFLSDDNGDNGDDDDHDGGNETENDGNESDDDGNADDDDSESSGEVRWPAIDDGVLLEDFEGELYDWSGEVSADSDEARRGSQAAVIEDEEGEEAGLTVYFSDDIDLTEHDVSVAIKPEQANRVVVEFIAPGRNRRLTTVRTIPDEYTGWMRLDCGYEHKPSDEPDLTQVSAINIIASNGERPIKMYIDDLRKTESVDNGKAILLFHGGFDSHYEIAAPLLEERDWAAAVPVNTEAIGTEGRMDVDELRELQEDGWDVCSNPPTSTPLPDMPDSRQQTVLENAKEVLEGHGFEDGARHLLVPDDRMDETTHEVIREIHETAFLSGSCPSTMPPTARHMLSHVWGPALHEGVRRHINLADQYNQLTVLRVPQIVDDDDVDPDSEEMSLDDFEHLLNHIEHRGLDVITPSDIVDETYERERDEEEVSSERPDDTIFEAGQSHEFDGSGSETTSTFDLDEGVAIVSFSTDGDDEFTIELEGDDGGALTTTAGAVAGESIRVVEGGTYRLDIDADGDWVIDLSQPEIHGDDLTELPIERSGTGSSIVGPLWAPEDVSLSLTHDGDGEFIVDGYSAGGSSESIVNQTGEFDSPRSFAANGVVWINIEADGDWTLEAEDV
jgi:hypothetical protein